MTGIRHGVPDWPSGIQTRGNPAVIAVDPIGILVAPLSNCLQSKGATGLVPDHDPATATFAPALMKRVANNADGFHNSTLHPRGSSSNPDPFRMFLGLWGGRGLGQRKHSRPATMIYEQEEET